MDNFILVILEYTEIMNLHKSEQFFIDLLRPKYNIVLIAGFKLGISREKKTNE